MINIIQDFKDWKNARLDVIVSKQNLERYRDSIIKKCEGKEFFNNLFKTDAFYSAIPLIKTKEDFYKLREYGAQCRSSACFFKLYEYLGTVCVPLGFPRRYELSPDHVFSCVNVIDNGVIDDVRCADCPYFDQLVEYQLLSAKLKQAQENQQELKQKLLDNFRFWKQR